MKHSEPEPEARLAEERCAVAIVGAGAAGLAAAIFAAEAAPGARIVALDGAARLGAKILVAGGGRCNVTHERVEASDFNGEPRVVRAVLAAFGVEATIRWFASLGVPLKCEPSGKLFPVNDRASSVLSALLDRCAALGVDLRTGRRVQAISRESGADGLLVQHQQGSLSARAVIAATGGRSLPRTGSDGGGWAIVRQLGHTVTPTVPALAPLVLADGFFHARLAGVSLPVELTTLSDGRPVDRRTGSLLWTHFGVSGPVVLDASRHWLMARARGAKRLELRSNLLPGMTFERADAELLQRAERQPRLSIARALAERLPARLAEEVLTLVDVPIGTPLAQLARVQRRALCHALTALALPVLRDCGWNYAEATAGGVPLSEIDPRSMASRLVPGLYLAGEMLDCDGRIGGFNFQWAWSTGYLAGRAAGRTVIER